MAGREFRLDRLPPLGHGHAAAPAEGVVDAAEDRKLLRLVLDPPEVRRQRGQRRLVLDRGDAPDGVGEDVGNFRLQRDLERQVRLHRNQGLEGVPVHQGQVVIVGVLRVRQQAAHHLPPVGRGQPLHRRREIEAHHRRSRVGSAVGEILLFLPADVPVLARELDRPAGQIRHFVAERDGRQLHSDGARSPQPASGSR